MNLPANRANATKRHEEANRQEHEEESVQEKIWLVETLQIFLNVGFNFGF